MSTTQTLPHNLCLHGGYRGRLAVRTQDRMHIRRQWSLVTYDGIILFLTPRERKEDESKVRQHFDISTATGITVTDLQAQCHIEAAWRSSLGFNWLMIHRQCCLWEDNCSNFGYSCSRLTEGTPRSFRGKKASLTLASKSSFQWKQLPGEKRYHPKRSLQPREIVSKVKKTWSRPGWNRPEH